ncbi:MAG TPA: DUF5060 domain-containing protein [Verrucomicrobiae bacterium]|nr:DUF5060 domain-containing protein [Verrucomicrobiae bacterium]
MSHPQSPLLQVVRTIARSLLLPLWVWAVVEAQGAGVQIIPKWGVFEQTLRSSTTYDSPSADCSLQAEFTSPSGETSLIDGFWDGGRTWRLRFKPDQAGNWKYVTRSSDPANSGLRISGQFVCIAPSAETRFSRHGPVVGEPRTGKFQHRDGSPFFWIADTLRIQAIHASHDDLAFYAQTRWHQQFSAVHLSIPAREPGSRSAHAGAQPAISYFQRLDRAISLLNSRDLLCAIRLELPRSVSDSEAAALFRYANARWHAWDVAWIFDQFRVTGSNTLLRAELASHPDVTAILARERLALNAEPWVDGLLVRGTNRNLTNPLIRAQLRLPVLVELTAHENALSASKHRVTADAVRRELWPALLLGSAGGFAYQAQGVAIWDTTAVNKDELPLWQRSLFLPGAKQMRIAAELFDSMEEEHEVRIASPDASSVALAMDSNKTFRAYYCADQDVLELPSETIPDMPGLRWLNPRTGETREAVAVLGSATIKVPAPTAADWILLVRSRPQRQR